MPPGTTYSYDALGRTTNVLLPDGASHTQYNPAPPNPPPAYPVTSAPTHTLLTSYTYDQLNHLTQVSMPRSTGTQTRTFVYDPATQRLSSATNPENGTVSYTYNPDGTLASKLDAKGNTETYTYDSYGRLTGIPDRHQTFTYDTCPAQDSFCVSTPGQLVEAVFGSNIGPNQLTFQYNYAYTPAGKVSSKTLTVQSANHRSMWNVPASGPLTASYTYDNQGALTSMVYPTLQTWATAPVQTFTYTLDAMERPTGLSDDWTHTSWASGVTYTPAGQSSFGGRAYNNLLQLTQVGQMTYTYSSNLNNGQISSSVDANSGESITYTYDALKRLSTANGLNWGETYTYDGFGNLTQMQPSGTAGAPSLSVSVDAATNRIQPSGVTYDSNGNVKTGFGGMTLNYNAANLVSSATFSGHTANYTYDPQNLRMYSRDESGNEKIYFYGANGQKLAVYTYTIITYNGDPQIQLTQQSQNAYFTGFLVEAEGVRVSTDRLGSVKWREPSSNPRYYPYGVEYAATGNDTEKYATYTRDGVTGLDYAVNRYYSSQWGRFLSPDPSGGSIGLGSPQSWNRYAYVRNDPANNSDPSGLFIGWPQGPPPPPPFGGIGLFGGDLANSSSVCQAYMQAVYAMNTGYDGNTSNGNFAGFPGALASCTAFFSGYGGAGGGGNAGIAHSPGSHVGPAGFADALATLQNAGPDCLHDLHALSTNQAVSKLMSSTIQYQYGAQPTVDLNTGLVTNGATPASSDQNDNSITINLNFGWYSPASVPVINSVTGARYYTDFLASVGSSIGQPSMTAVQYYELVILHELGHNLGVPQEADSSYNKAIFDDCIK